MWVCWGVFPCGGRSSAAKAQQQIDDMGCAKRGVWHHGVCRRGAPMSHGKPKGNGAPQWQWQRCWARSVGSTELTKAIGIGRARPATRSAGHGRDWGPGCAMFCPRPLPARRVNPFPVDRKRARDAIKPLRCAVCMHGMDVLLFCVDAYNIYLRRQGPQRLGNANCPRRRPPVAAPLGPGMHPIA
jgi:hypothetical protein